MKRCFHCRRLIWFWQTGLDSRKGPVHLQCWMDFLDSEFLGELIERLKKAFQHFGTFA